MFNNKYHLTQAVLEGRKTMTRRLVPIGLYNMTDWKAVTEGDYEAVVDGEGYYHDIRDCGKYRVDEGVAIAQAYKEVDCAGYPVDSRYDAFRTAKSIYILEKAKGWNNKMFVQADLMPHHIKITNVRVERLQDISDEDCFKEGITKVCEGFYTYDEDSKLPFDKVTFPTPKEAFAALIDKVSGKGTWERNPWVFAYSFELENKRL